MSAFLRMKVVVGRRRVPSPHISLVGRSIGTVAALTAVVTALTLLVGSPALAHGQDFAWHRMTSYPCSNLGGNYYITGYGEATTFPEANSQGTADTGGYYDGAGVWHGSLDVNSGQWVYYRIWVGYYYNGRPYYLAGNWMAGYNGFPGSGNTYRQLSDGTWKPVWFGRYDSATSAESTVQAPMYGTYYLWAEYQWGDITNARGQLIRSGSQHWEPLGQITCR